MLRLKGAQKLNQFLQSTNRRSSQSLSLFLRDSQRHFSAENERQSQSQSQTAPQTPNSSTPIDPLLYQSDTGLTYGKLMGISPNTLKTDIINLFERCNLTQDDIKVDYNRMFNPMTMVVQFSSVSDFYAASRQLPRKNRYFTLEKADRQLWDSVVPYNGRYALFQGIPRNALMDDVERLLSGCNYDASSIELFARGTPSGILRMAKVRFSSQIETMNAVIRKNGAFCLNYRILARLIQ